MKRILLPAALLLALAASGRGQDAKPAAMLVRHEVHDGYFVSNRFEPDAPVSFVAALDQQAFDAVFGVAMVMRDRSHRLPPGAFGKKLVVAAIHRGKAFVTYQVESVTRDTDTLVVRYTTKSEPNETAEFACPLILSVDKHGFAKVRFVENGKEAKVLGLAGDAVAGSFAVECQKPGSLSASVAEGKAVISIQGAGIGRGKVACPADAWPGQVTLKAHLGGLESLTLGGAKVQLKLSVLSHRGHPTLIRLLEDGKEGPRLGQDSPFWTEVRRVGPDGKEVEGLPPQGGWFELQVPRALLDGCRSLSIDWIDFFRG